MFKTVGFKASSELDTAIKSLALVTVDEKTGKAFGDRSKLLRFLVLRELRNRQDVLDYLESQDIEIPELREGD